MSPIQCYKCKKLQSYPFLKLPLGPAEIKESEKKTDMKIQRGFVSYAWFCLPCGKEHLLNLTEEFLSSPQN